MYIFIEERSLSSLKINVLQTVYYFSCIEESFKGEVRNNKIKHYFPSFTSMPVKNWPLSSKSTLFMIQELNSSNLLPLLAATVSFCPQRAVDGLQNEGDSLPVPVVLCFLLQCDAQLVASQQILLAGSQGVSRTPCLEVSYC